MRQAMMPLVGVVVLFCLACSAMAQQSPGGRQGTTNQNSGNIQAPPGLPASAQGQATAAQVRQFVSNFNRNIAKGCLQSRLEGLRNPQGYCNCYAQAFTNRYAAADLVAINTAATSSKIAVEVITLMMAPERRMCKASN